MAAIKTFGSKGFHFQNWAETYSCCPEVYFEPTDVEQIRQILELAQEEKKTVRVVGCGHSPSDIACTTDFMVSLKHFNKLLEVDADKKTFLAEAGVVLTDLNEQLDSHGLAFSVLGSVSNLTLAGVLSTGTHGTGIHYGCLSSYVTEVEIMLASGEVRTLTKEQDGDVFRAAALSLGSLGILLKIRVQCEATFNLQQTKYGAQFKDVLENLDVHLKASEHMRICWYPHTDKCVVFHNRRTDKDMNRRYSWFWEYFIGFWLLELLLWISCWFRSFIPKINKIYCAIDGQPGEFVDKSYRVFNFNCLFKQYVMEWSVPVDKTQVVLFELKSWLESNGFCAHFPVEIRFVKGDDLLLSPAHGHDSCYINIIMYRPYGRLIEHAQYWRVFKEIMLKYGGRPHWAKDHLMTSHELGKLYPKWETFCKIRQEFDPKGTFMNDNLKATLSYS